MSKTPVSIIQEYCARNMIIPEYDLIINGVGTHDPIFKYKLTIKNIITYGVGKSKKEAKHEAARQAIVLLPDFKSSTSSTNGRGTCQLSEDITAPYQGAFKENSVGELLTLCCNNQLPPPVYVVTGEEGPAHARWFTIECHVNKIIETAAARTKQQAKHQSAKLMVERLKGMLGDKLLLTPPEPSEDCVNREKELDETAKLAYASLQTVKLGENFDLLIADYHSIDLTKIVFGDDHSALVKLSSWGTADFCHVGSLNFLEDLFKDAQVGIDFEELPSSNQNQFVIICRLNSLPTFVEYGMSNAIENAKEMSAHKMLSLLKLFCSGINLKVNQNDMEVV